MQLKLQRSQREGGVMSKTIIFCLDARVEFTPEESRNILRYRLQKQVIYNSEASKKALASGDARVDGSTVGYLKSIAFTAMAALNLNISIDSLQRGQHVACKSLDELLGAEDAIMTACRNLKSYLDTASTFDGREVLFDFTTGEPEIVATATTPIPMLVAPPAPSHAVVSPAPQVAADPYLQPNACRHAEPLPPFSSPAQAVNAGEYNDFEVRFERALLSVPPESWKAIGLLALFALILFITIATLF